MVRIANSDSYRIDLPQRTFGKFQITPAGVEEQNFRDGAQDVDMDKLQRQVCEANQKIVSPAPPKPRGQVTFIPPGERLINHSPVVEKILEKQAGGKAHPQHTL